MFRKHALPILLIGITGVMFAVGLICVHRTRPIPRLPSSSQKSLQDFYTEAQQTTRIQETEEQRVTFLAVGDISLSRAIAATIQAKHDPLYPFSKVDSLLKSTDFNFANLETPFSSNDSFTAKNTLVFNAPKHNVVGLTAYNFAVLNLANNHAFDQGLDGITTTTNVLDSNGILHMGTGQTLNEAWTPAIIHKNGITIGFIGASYASSNDGGKTTNNYVARIEDINRLKAATSKLKASVDFVVVTMHAGTEYTPTANSAQITFAHAAIDAGADIVIGAHPHWVQNKEQYCPRTSSPPTQGSLENAGGTKGGTDSNKLANSDLSNCKWIYYSLGNFIFDQNWSEQTKRGLTLKITLSKPKTRLSSGTHNAPQSNKEIGNNSSNSAKLSDLQPSKSPIASDQVVLSNIEEIPIYIEDNCCPTIAAEHR